MKLLYMDPSLAGISGNMVLGALLDLGASEKKLQEIAAVISKELGCEIKLETKKVSKNGFKALYFEGEIKEKIKERTAREFLNEFKKISKLAKFGEEAQRFALSAIDTMLQAEAKVHGASLKRLHLHELASADTFLDVIGAAALLEELDLFNARIISSAVTTGKGKIRTSHGVLSVPAPITLEILRTFEIPFQSGGEEGELATPTGLALLANLAADYAGEIPSVRVIKTGSGAGKAGLKVPNVLRILLCETNEKHTAFVSILETNLDDVSGEIIGYALERLYEEGALDVQIMPTITKKNRPGHIISVMCRPGEEEKFAKILIEETGTLGVRISRAQKRFHAGRETKTLRFKNENVRIKIARLGNNVINVKPEYEDVKKIAKKFKLPLKKVIWEIERSIPF